MGDVTRQPHLVRGPGGFYDDLGDVTRQAHLVRGPGFDEDPAFLESALMGFAYRAGGRTSWWNYAESLNEMPLKMRYTGLDPCARYRVRVVYAGDSLQRKIRLSAGDNIEIHPLIDKPVPIRPMEFDIPAKAVQRGELTLSWYRDARPGRQREGLPGGRGVAGEGAGLKDTFNEALHQSGVNAVLPGQWRQ